MELFTEAQWRAIAYVEERTRHNGECLFGISKKKPIHGPMFRDGEYFLGCYALNYGHHAGPPAPSFFVGERTAGLILTDAHVIRGEALAEARAMIEVIGPSYFARMLANGAATNARRIAADAARDAIAKAKTTRKLKKISKRAKAVFTASSGKCHYCSTPLTLDGKWHIEHKMPRALFGGSEQSNLVASCTRCNHAKRDRTDLEFVAARSVNSET